MSVTPELDFKAFADWCETKPVDELYAYVSTNCACAQYAATLGIEDWVGSGWTTLWDRADDLASMRPRTFHALAQRLRA